MSTVRNLNTAKDSDETPRNREVGFESIFIADEQLVEPTSLAVGSK